MRHVHTHSQGMVSPLKSHSTKAPTTNPPEKYNATRNGFKQPNSSDHSKMIKAMPIAPRMAAGAPKTPASSGMYMLEKFMHAETTRQMPVTRGIPGLPCKGAIRREQAAAPRRTAAAIMLKAANPKPVWSCAGNAMAPLEYTVSVHTRNSPMPAKAKGISMKRSLKPANRFAFISHSPLACAFPFLRNNPPPNPLCEGIIALRHEERRSINQYPPSI